MKDVKSFLDKYYLQYNNKEFLKEDPIQIPHRFSKKQDVEITAFWTAILAWGQRKTIINKATELFNLMDNSPHDFIIGHQEKDLEKFLAFKHRTFQSDDTLYFIHFLKHHYQNNDSLEDAFIPDSETNNDTTFEGLVGFRQYFFSLENHLRRTEKHISSPLKKSTCKRLNMFLRWMVREDGNSVDFGIWKKIKPAQLMMPLDVHVERVARHIGLLTRKQRDWTAVEELTSNLRKLDPTDPVKYDYALFGYGVSEK